MFKVFQDGELWWIAGPGLSSGHGQTTKGFAEEVAERCRVAFALGQKIHLHWTERGPFIEEPASDGYQVRAGDVYFGGFSGIEGARVWAGIYNGVYEAGVRAVQCEM